MKQGHIPKGWGEEVIWANTDKYCGKFLNFKAGARFSMHFHKDKDETWYVLSGRFELRCINTKNAQQIIQELKVGDVWHNPPLSPHQLVCFEEGTIIEVSTADSAEDNYRVMPGDSQRL